MHRIKERRKRSHQSKNPFVYAQGMREEKQAIEILALFLAGETPRKARRTVHPLSRVMSFSL